MQSSTSDPADDERESLEPDYAAITLSTTKSPTEFSYVERRADILSQIQDVGHPSALNQTELADRYDVCQQQISKDFDRLSSYVHGDLGDREKRALAVGKTVERSIRGLLENGKYRAAARTAIEYDEWATDFVDLERLHEQVEELEAATNDEGSGW